MSPTVSAPSCADSIPTMPEHSGFTHRTRHLFVPYTFVAMRALFNETDWNRIHHHAGSPGDTWIHLSRDLQWFEAVAPVGTPLPTMLALRVMDGLGYTTWMVVDYMNFYLDSHDRTNRSDAVEDDAFLTRVLETIASGLPWRTAHYARHPGLFDENDLHQWLDTFGAPLMEACARAGLTGEELRSALDTGVPPDADMLKMLGALNNYKTRDD